ncbi:ATP-dependent RNA helicase HrpA [Microlunatus sp. Y2014]|uniref:ATP-dependent RNA helicase HrpA n=1 Tax=Microlunatus sp. Y2014 TaxID=3418488 RepID=UPI003DA71440
MFRFDPDLPISGRVDDIAAAIEAHPVVIVAGETGSGKTTQLPKICLQLGRRHIGHTQPRRIAARSVAERVAGELGSELGDLVGYQVRFTRRAGRDTRLKIMTDGVLLNEIGFDRDLKRYDTIIIDEAHERSLNIDFLLGYLKQLLTRRDDLKVIVTSATIDTARFAEHFDDAPIIEVSGRTYPVELRYRPIYDDSAEHRPVDPDRDQLDAVCDAVQELQGESSGFGDILVFLSGEREIRDTATALDGLKLPHTEVIPLYARLSAAEQHKVFAPHTGQRVVLSTNVAETSLTVPGIRYVVDAGTARISRYSARTKVQRLPIEPISQASANQRSGRCGRTAPGIAIRLYSEEDFAARPEFTEPEILRTNLASVILQMADARLGDIARFPFVEPPDSAQIADGVRLLDELGALAEPSRKGGVRLTPVGRRLARMPVDPRMARMLVAAEERHCLTEVMIIVAGLSIQDPRERPQEKREQADALHRRFWAPPPEPDDAARAPSSSKGSPGVVADGSDFLAWLRLWDHVKAQQKALSGNAFRRMCRDEFLHYLRIREWQDLHTQLGTIAKELGLQRNREPADADDIHTAILSGLLSQVGLADLRDEEKSQRSGRRDKRRPMREYLGARGARFAIQPGSSVAKQPPPLVMAAELVETSRLWARTVAGIDARWVEAVGGHLLKRRYAEPHWSTRQQAVLAYETVTLYGVPIIARRKINYGRINPAEAREVFIRSALVEGQWRTRHAFWQHNEDVRAEAEQVEERARRRGQLVDDEVIFAFYDQRLPPEVVSAAHFDSWWKKVGKADPTMLHLDLADLIRDDADRGAVGDFPDHLTVRTTTGEVEVPLAYAFDPGSGRDGVTATVGVDLLNQIPAHPFSWQVPGLRLELVTELIRSLPKQVRVNFVPAPDHARRALRWFDEQGIGPADMSLTDALSRALQHLGGQQVTGFDLSRVPPHLQMTIVVDEGGEHLAEGKDLPALVERLRPRLTRNLTRAARTVAKQGATDWQFDTVRPEVTLARGTGPAALGHPALTDEGDTVGLVVYDHPDRAAQAARRGLRRLVMLNTPDPTKWVVSHLSNQDKFAVGGGPYASAPALLADARLASVGSLITVDPRSVTDEPTFRRLCDTVRTDNADRMRQVVSVAAEAIRRAAEVRNALPLVGVADARADIAEQADNLVFDGFLAATPYQQLVELPRYLRGAATRIETLRATPEKDDRPAADIAEVEDAYAELCSAVPPGPLPDAIADIGWGIEELRVSLFAQRLGTRRTVSVKRLRNAIAAARRELT